MDGEAILLQHPLDGVKRLGILSLPICVKKDFSFAYVLDEAVGVALMIYMIELFLR